MAVARIATESDTRALAQALLDADALGHALSDPRIVETHISVVLLTGPFAYKLRKPLQLPFLDFRTLQARREDCERELALNRRWAPDIYEAVVAVRGDPASPRLHGTGSVLDYAVKMHQFPEQARLDRVIAARGLDDALTDRLAEGVAAMHLAAPAAVPGTTFGAPAANREQVQGNLDDLAKAPLADAERRRLEKLASFSLRELDRLDDVFVDRIREGKVRECHGDLHLANLVLLDGVVVPFDGVEFREDFRWVDIVSDLAFLLMDLNRLDHAGPAWRLLDGWLTRTGDHAGLAVLRHYQVYRALVRAKVEAIRLGQLAGSADRAGRDAAYASVAGYLDLAERMSRPAATRALIITHGVSGSGKSHIARRLIPALGAVMLRSDVERKRLHPDPDERYSPDASARVYRHLLDRAETILALGYPVILDATFLDRHWREAAARLAGDADVPFRILSARAPRPVLEARIVERLEAGTDPSEADLGVLHDQLTAATPLDPTELAVCVQVDSAGPIDADDLQRRLLL